MAQEDNIIIGPRPNKVDDSGTSLLAGSEAAALPVENLQDRRLGKVWRTTTTDEDDTFVEVNYGEEVTHGMVAIGPHNLEKGSLYRVRVGDISIAVDTVEAPTGTIFTGAYTTGDYTDVDEPFDGPDAFWVTADDHYRWTQIQLSFGPATGLAAGDPGASFGFEGSQRFKVRARASQATDEWPLLTVAPMEETSPGVWVIYTGQAQTYEVNSASNFTVDFLWDTSILQDPDNNVGIRLLGKPNSAGASARATVEYGTVEWRQAVFTDDINYDSGYQEVWPRLAEFGALPWGVFEWGGYLAEEFAEQTDLWIFHPIRGGVLGQYLRIDFIDPKNADGYLEFGRLLAGPALQPVKNISYGWSIKFEDNSRVTKSRGGATWIDEEKRYRVLEFTIEHLSKSDVFDSFFNWLDRLGGIAADFAVMIFPEDQTQYYNLAMYCRQRDIGAVTNPFFERYSKTFVFEELI